MITKFKQWIEDYIHASIFYSKSFIYRESPKHYLGHIVDTKVPIILIPGINTKWQFLKIIADELSKIGHPIYIVRDLGYNRKSIHDSAKIVRNLIDKTDLKNIIILAHSKGGLIGKEILIHFNNDERVIKVIAVATPFLGSDIGKIIPDKAVKELSPQSDIIIKQNNIFHVNEKIISIYGMYDNHVWPTENSILQGAENIQIKVDGHHKILSNKNARHIIIQKIEEITLKLKKT